MPDEPKKPIEDLLQASAKARRAEFGSDPKMPNPMRAQLHDEIRRMAREDEPKPRRSWNWFAISWPVGTVAAAVLVVAFVMSRSHELQPPNESRQSAANPHARGKGLLRRAAPQVAAKAAARSTTESTDLGKADEEKSNASGSFADVAAAPKQEMPAAEPRLENPGSSSAFFVQQGQKTQININQQFSRNLPRVAARASKPKDAINVLNTFQIQQTGDQIRVVDADGSTYTGKIEPIAQDALQSKRALPEQENSNQFSFRATGYNSSLKKPIVFEGNYIAMPTQRRRLTNPPPRISSKCRRALSELRKWAVKRRSKWMQPQFRNDVEVHLSAQRQSGERTRLACPFRRLAETNSSEPGIVSYGKSSARVRSPDFRALLFIKW